MAVQKATYHIGETITTNSGRKATIIAWRNKIDIDVEFEDGIIVSHKRYYNFKRGSIAHPEDGKFGSKWKFPNHLGKESISAKGEKMKIVAFTDAHNFDVQFEDGTIIHCTSYYDFCKGAIKNPNYLAKTRVGEEVIAKNGLKAKIVKYIDCHNVVIQFEDGIEIVKDYNSFKTGNLKHPNISGRRGATKNKYEGKTFIAHNGMKYKVLCYTNASNILIQFEDSTELITYVSAICHGNILNPNCTFQKKRQKEQGFQKTIGMPMIITNYESATNITVQFDDGCEVRHKNYQNFKDGTIKHPFPYTVGTITMQKPAYVYNREGNFYCKCSKCGLSDIMSLKEIKEHKHESIYKQSE